MDFFVSPSSFPLTCEHGRRVRLVSRKPECTDATFGFAKDLSTKRRRFAIVKRLFRRISRDFLDPEYFSYPKYCWLHFDLPASKK